MNLEEYKKKFPELKEKLTKLENTAKKSEIFKDLSEHEGIRLIIDELADIINTINTKLLSNDELSTEERNSLIIDRSRCMWFGEIFQAQNQILEKINSYIKNL